jgi:hypothetical protein
MTQLEREAPEATIEFDGEDIFVSFEGVRIAKRGHRGMPQAQTWILLEPGYRVFDTDDGDIVIERTLQ